MFEDALMENRVKDTSRWSVVLSTVIQLVLVGVMLLIPLLNYYELPATDFVSFLTAPPPPPPPPPPPAAVVIKAVPKEFDTGALTQPVAIPDQVAIIEEDIAAPSAGIAGVVGGVPGGSVGGTVGGVLGSIISSAPTAAPPAPPPPPVKKKAPPKRIRVGGNVAKARLTRQVRPQYPPLARQARIQGTVKLSAIIAKDGSIQKLEVMSGHPLLVPAALSAVKQWRYRPTLLNGEAVEVLTNIDVNFTLSG
ncbi:MAG: TonB family protein [Bryobacterales bacterium]|nr:TonB family protein [Bryobacterales bacterium]